MTLTSSGTLRPTGSWSMRMLRESLEKAGGVVDFMLHCVKRPRRAFLKSAGKPAHSLEKVQEHPCRPKTTPPNRHPPRSARTSSTAAPPGRKMSPLKSSSAASAIPTCTPRAANGPAHSTPCVPGHEIVGKVMAVGAKVTKFKPGQLVGVGCMVDSCRTCHSCQEGLEQYCEGPVGFTGTYNGPVGGGANTYGGYSAAIAVDEHFVLNISHDEKDLAGAAPLLCAGFT